MKIYLLTFLLILMSKLYCQDWQFIGLDSMVVRQVYVFGDTIWAGTAVPAVQSQIAGLYRSTNNGKDWMQIDTVLGGGAIISLNFHPSNHNTIYLVKGLSSYSGGGKLYKSTNSGNNWEEIIVSDYFIQWFGISPFDNNKIYAVEAAGEFNEVFKSTDDGDTWELISSFPASSHGRYVTFNISLAKDSVLFAMVDIAFEQYFFVSTDDGYSWLNAGRPPYAKEIITDNELDCRIYLHSYYVSFVTDDCGLNWSQTDSLDLSLESYYVSFYIDTLNAKLYMMKNTGIYVADKTNINWKKIESSEELPIKGGYQPADIGRLKNMIVTDGSKTMYVGTLSGLYMSNNITGINYTPNISGIKKYSLFQNYPNPFNPETKIRYTIPQFSLVTIKVYDMLGREVKTLVNKEQSEGNYEVEFNASDLPSGTYIYELRVNDYSSYKKLMVLK